MELLIQKCTSTANTTRCSRTPKYIVIHYTAGTSSKPGTAKSTALYFAKKSTKASADFIVDDSTIVQYNPDLTKYYCWAVGGNRYSSMSTSEGGKYYSLAKNSNCINIEMCSNKTNKSSLKASDTDWYFTDATLKNAIKLTKYLMSLYKIPVKNVIMHHHVNGKICPNPFCVKEEALCRWNAFKNQLENTNSSTSNSSISKEELYRVRKVWTDSSTQIGAFLSLENAKKACKDGYCVFDSRGNIVYSTLSNSSSKIPSSPSKTKVTYMSHCINQSKWCSEVVGYHSKDSSGYSGILGKPIDKFTIRLSQGNITYTAHKKGGTWLEEVSGYSQTNSSQYAGVTGKPIDAIALKADGIVGTLKYRVHTKPDNRWWGWVTGYSKTDSKKYAGVFGKEIDAIQIGIE